MLIRQEMSEHYFDNGYGQSSDRDRVFQHKIQTLQQNNEQENI